eukprot:9485532-Pyramimonas_sp.AAC.1
MHCVNYLLAEVLEVIVEGGKDAAGDAALLPLGGVQFADEPLQPAKHQPQLPRKGPRGRISL